MWLKTLALGSFIWCLGTIAADSTPATAVAPLLATKTISVNLEDKWLQARTADLTPTLQSARIVPYLDGDKFAGFQILKMEKKSPFRTLKLAKGDVLMEVAGVRINNPGAGLEAFQKLRGATDIPVFLRRKGKIIRVDYHVLKPAGKK